MMINSEIILFLISIIASLLVIKVGYTVMSSTQKYSNNTVIVDKYLKRLCSEMGKNTSSIVFVSDPYCKGDICSFEITIIKNSSSCSVRT